METPGASVRNKSSIFPFMKLPVEIRLAIYSYLLIAPPFRSKDPSRSKQPSKGITLWITGVTGETDKCCSYAISSNGDFVEKSLTSQILRTCKTICREAAPILYSENVFQFWLVEWGVWKDPNCRSPSKDSEVHYKLESLPLTAYQFPLRPWSADAPINLPRCAFAAFLQKIGQQNAANLKRLKFVGESLWLGSRCTHLGRAILMVTNLVKCHAPGVRQMKICYDLNHWDAFENGLFEPVDHEAKYCGTVDSIFHDDKFPPKLEKWCDVLRRTEQKTLYQAVGKMTQDITWLKQLRITGFEEERDVQQKIEEFQALIQARN